LRPVTSATWPRTIKARRLVDADAQRLGVRLHQGGHVGEVVALAEVLIDDRAGQQVEALPGPRLRVAAGDHQPRQGRRARGGAADHAPALQDRVQLLLEAGADVGGCQAGLVAAAEPDAGGLAQWREELRVVGLLVPKVFTSWPQ
jgi:hypothetical protein